MKNKILSKKASASISKAITVLTAVVLGAAMLVGGVGIIKTTVLPTTTTKVQSMFEHTEEISAGGGSIGDDISPVVPAVGTERATGSLIPTGGKYTKADGTMLISNGTNTFPNSLTVGDKYEENGITYTYEGDDWTYPSDASGEKLLVICGKDVVPLVEW